MIALKMIFADLPEDHPYHFDPENYEKTGLLIDTAYNKSSGIWGKKPIITVARGSQTTDVQMLGDMTTRNMTLASRKASNIVGSTVDIRVVSPLKDEAEIISERVFCSLMMLRTLLPELCGVHYVSNISMSPAQQLEQDDVCYEVDLTMQFSMQYKWDHVTPVSILQGIQTWFNDTIVHK